MVKHVTSLRWPAAGLALLALAACSDTSTSPIGGPNFTTSGSSGATASLCKRGPEGTWATFSISATGGNLPAGI